MLLVWNTAQDKSLSADTCNYSAVSASRLLTMTLHKVSAIHVDSHVSVFGRKCTKNDRRR